MTKSANSRNTPVEQIKFTQEEIETVRQAIRAARKDMDEWKKASKVNPDRMNKPIGRKGEL